MSLTGAHLIEMCETKGAEDGAVAARYSPPVIEAVEPQAYAAYVTAYWEVLFRSAALPALLPDRTIVRRARMVALNRRLREDRRHERK